MIRMQTFLTVILFIFAGFWLLGRFGQWMFRWWLARKQREFQQRFGGDTAAGGDGGNGGAFRGFYANFGQAGNRQKRRRKEGEVTVTQSAVRSERRVAKGVGDYVEYEEIETESTTTTIATGDSVPAEGER